MVIRLIIALLFLCSPALADDMVNSGGILNKGLLFCASDGTGCVKAKQVNAVAGITDNADGSIQLLGGSGGGGSGNVGIGTIGRAVVQIDTTTTGTPYNNNFDSNGNLGIGTLHPGTALDVNGSIRASNYSGTHSGTSSGMNTGDQDLSGLALKTIAINTTAPLTGNGTLASNITLGMAQATTSANGYLTTTATSIRITKTPSKCCSSIKT